MSAPRVPRRFELQRYALDHAWETPEVLNKRAFRFLPLGWKLALSFNR